MTILPSQHIFIYLLFSPFISCGAMSARALICVHHNFERVTLVDITSNTNLARSENNSFSVSVIFALIMMKTVGAVVCQDTAYIAMKGCRLHWGITYQFTLLIPSMDNICIEIDTISVCLSVSPPQGDPSRWRYDLHRCPQRWGWCRRCYWGRWCYGDGCHLHPLAAYEPGQTLPAPHQRPHSPQQEPRQHRPAGLQCKLHAVPHAQIVC